MSLDTVFVIEWRSKRATGPWKPLLMTAYFSTEEEATREVVMVYAGSQLNDYRVAEYKRRRVVKVPRGTGARP